MKPCGNFESIWRKCTKSFCLCVRQLKVCIFSALPVEDISRQGKGLHPLLSRSPASRWHLATVSYKPEGHKVRPPVSVLVCLPLTFRKNLGGSYSDELSLCLPVFVFCYKKMQLAYSLINPPLRHTSSNFLKISVNDAKTALAVIKASMSDLMCFHRSFKVLFHAKLIIELEILAFFDTNQ